MRATLLALAALAAAGPALAEPWGKQDWYVFDVPYSTEQLRVLDAHATGWAPPNPLLSGPTQHYSGIGRAGRSKVAVDINSIDRVGKALRVTYFVWSDRNEGFTEVTSRIDCSKTGELVVQARDFDKDFTHLGTADGKLRRADAAAIAIADHACRLPGDHRVSGLSLPELVRRGS